MIHIVTIFLITILTAMDFATDDQSQLEHINITLQGLETSLRSMRDEYDMEIETIKTNLDNHCRKETLKLKDAVTKMENQFQNLLFDIRGNAGLDPGRYKPMFNAEKGETRKTIGQNSGNSAY